MKWSLVVMLVPTDSLLAEIEKKYNKLLKYRLKARHWKAPAWLFASPVPRPVN